jgi:hypothetical protein
MTSLKEVKQVVSVRTPAILAAKAALDAANEKSSKPKGSSPTHPRTRTGKTAKDHRNGAKNKNQQNKDSRAMWQNDTKSTSFPAASCNGKRNRYQVTGKGNETVFLRDNKAGKR